MKEVGEKGFNEWAANVDPDKVSLRELEMPAITKDLVDKVDAEREDEHARMMAFREKYLPIYGDRWLYEYLKQIEGDTSGDYDKGMKVVNTWIYMGYASISVSATPHIHCKIMDMFRERQKFIYGERFEELQGHINRLEEAGEWLIQDALKTGKWRELPDGLQDEYHKRIAEIGGNDDEE